MATVQEIFKTRAASFQETMNGSSGVLSFKVPEYQRPYDWDRGNVQRLLHDCLNGLKVAVSLSRGHCTFLGTIILVPDGANKSAYELHSQLIVDGQQRLTTLLLLSCALFEAIRIHQSDVSKVSDVKVRAWLEQECKEQLNRLYTCTTGNPQGLPPTNPFPRMVRTEDELGHSTRYSHYRSEIARFLQEFQNYCSDDTANFPSNVSDSDSHLTQIYRYISGQIVKHVYRGASDDQHDEFDPRLVHIEEFKRGGSRDLFVRLMDLGGQDVENLASQICRIPDSEGLIRLLLFSSYLMQSVVLAIVEAPSEDVAFDIFDALNTTGEPLTALETLKPHIVRFERDKGGYQHSETEESWELLERNLIDVYESPDLRQKQTKELVTGTALYYVGERVGNDLKEQRDKLKQYFSNAEQRGDDVAREFVWSLGRLAEFRRKYWDKDAIHDMGGSQPGLEDDESLKLCLRFIADTNTSLVIPILARYWIKFREMDPEQHFLKAVKAVTAFLALRRGMTGGTARIDSDFRRMMSHGGQGTAYRPLCVGPSMTNEVPSIGELKRGLRSLLAASKLGVTDKQTWLGRAREIPLANQSKVVCRFLLLAAAHGARPDPDHPGLLKAEGIRESTEVNFLTYSAWVGPSYATLEHVAPDSGSKNEWDRRIYERMATRHTIGNIVLLPREANENIGNASWEKKRHYYRALVARTEGGRDNAIESAKQEGRPFNKRTQSAIISQYQLPMLGSLADVEKWDADLIERRTENILTLAWNQIKPWLFD